MYVDDGGNRSWEENAERIFNLLRQSIPNSSDWVPMNDLLNSISLTHAGAIRFGLKWLSRDGRKWIQSKPDHRAISLGGPGKHPFDLSKDTLTIRLTQAGHEEIMRREILEAQAARARHNVEEHTDQLKPVSTMKAKRTDGSSRHVRYIFLDVEGFTLGKRRSHHQSKIIETLGGIVTKALTALQIPENEDSRLLLPTGDGICIALFNAADEPGTPLDLAFKILRGVSAFNTKQKDDALKFGVRVGINSGIDVPVTDIRGNKNLAGRGINDAQRIMSAGDGGNIVISDEDHKWLSESPKHNSNGAVYRRIDFSDKHRTQRIAYQYTNPKYAWLNNNPPRSPKPATSPLVEQHRQTLFWLGNDLRLSWHYAINRGSKEKLLEALQQIERHVKLTGIEKPNAIIGLAKELSSSLDTDWTNEERSSFVKRLNSTIERIDRKLRPAGGVSGSNIDLAGQPQRKESHSNKQRGTTNHVVRESWKRHDGKQLSSAFILSPEGAFSVWAVVTEEHNNAGKRFYRYIVSHSTAANANSGNGRFERYPNAWAIVRVTPSNEAPQGRWEFWCNGLHKGRLQLRMPPPSHLKPEPTLFTVEWSRTQGFVQFYINGRMVDKRSYEHWPDATSGQVVLGTWTNDDPSHRFNSPVGPCYTLSRLMKPADLNRLLRAGYSNEA